MFTKSWLRKTTCAPSPFPVSPPAFMDILRWPLASTVFFFLSLSIANHHHHHHYHHPGICLRGGSSHCEEVFGEAQGLCGQGRRESRYWMWWPSPSDICNYHCDLLSMPTQHHQHYWINFLYPSTQSDPSGALQVIFCLFLKEDVELYRERMPIIFPTTEVEKGLNDWKVIIDKIIKMKN